MTWNLHTPLGRFGVTAPGTKRKQRLEKERKERQELIANLRKRVEPRRVITPLPNSYLYQGVRVEPYPPAHSNIVAEYLRQHHLEWKDLTSEDAHQIAQIYARMIADGHEIS